MSIFIYIENIVQKCPNLFWALDAPPGSPSLASITTSWHNLSHAIVKLACTSPTKPKGEYRDHCISILIYIEQSARVCPNSFWALGAPPGSPSLASIMTSWHGVSHAIVKLSLTSPCKPKGEYRDYRMSILMYREESSNVSKLSLGTGCPS